MVRLWNFVVFLRRNNLRFVTIFRVPTRQGLEPLFAQNKIIFICKWMWFFCSYRTSPFRPTAHDGRRKHVVTSRFLTGVTRTYLCFVTWSSKTVYPAHVSSSHARRDRVGRRSFEIFIVSHTAADLLDGLHLDAIQVFCGDFPSLFIIYFICFSLRYRKPTGPRRQRSNA